MCSVARLALCVAAASALGCGTGQKNVPQAHTIATVDAPPAASTSSNDTEADDAGLPSLTPTKPSATTLWVRDKLVDCQGEGARRCMQVRASEQGEWEWFYDSIEGFDYEEGFLYELRVEVRDVEKPLTDRSARRYRLVELVSKRRAEEAPQPR